MQTTGFNSQGIFAQSVGGGGGNGGTAESSASGSTEETAQNGNLTFSLGGFGGAGGSGGTVSVITSGSVVTQGDAASAIVAQSIGGGGGDGNAASGSSQGTYTLAIGVGGFGGTGGAGGAVMVTNGAAIGTNGANAYGVFAQSVGGGGGEAGLAAGQSQGGTFGATVGVGGGGGGSGAGGAVNVTNNAAILTSGFGSDAIVGIRRRRRWYCQRRKRHVERAGISLNIGGRVAYPAAAASRCGCGAIKTLGDYAFGILAQSVGGGGGVGGVGAGSSNLTLSVGGSGGAAGNGGDVVVNVTGGITTNGNGASAIVAQSIGGGGGIGGDTTGATLSIGVSGSGGGAGNGGNVSVNNGGAITTVGANADGIFAQSIGGGGGVAGAGSNGLAFIGSAGGTGSGGAVTITQLGRILTLGNDSVGIFAQSQGGSGGGPIAINVNGSVFGGTGTNGAGVVTDTSGTSSIVNNRSIAAYSGIAIESVGTGVASIQNYGTITGNVLVSGSGTLTNEAGGLFYPGNTVTLGASGVLINSGTILPGGVGKITTTNLTGNFNQTATGIYDVNIAPGTGASDINVSGFAALNGTIAPNIVSLSASSAPMTIMTSGGGVVNNGVTLAPSPFFKYQLGITANAVTITIAGVNFTFPMLGGNQNAIGSHLVNAWNSGSLGGLGPLMIYLSKLNPGTSYAQALDHLSPGSYLASATPLMLNGMSFTNSLFSCYKPAAAGFVGTEQPCTWAQAVGQSTQQAYSSSTLGFTGSSQGIQGGSQRSLGSGRFFNYGLGYLHSSFAVGGDSSTQSNGINAGIAWKQQHGNATTMAEGLAASYDWLSTLRSPLPGVVASSQSGGLTLDARAEISSYSGRGTSYIKPYASADVLYVERPAVTETNAGAVGLNMQSMSKVLGVLTPGVEFGGTYAEPGGVIWRPYVNAGVSLFSSNSWSVSSTFVGSPAGATPFIINSSMPSVLFHALGGLQLSTPRVIWTFNYGLSIGSGYSSQLGNVKFDYRLEGDHGFTKHLQGSQFLTTSAALLGAPFVIAATSSAKPSIVFCHGLWADGSCFSKVMGPLQAQGYDCIAAQYALDSPESDVASAKRAMDVVKGPIVLVGHSYGGTVITSAGTDPRVKALVYINALAPDANETSQSIQAKFPSTEVLKHIQVIDGRIWLRKDGLLFFCGDLSPAEQNLVWATQGAPV